MVALGVEIIGRIVPFTRLDRVEVHLYVCADLLQGVSLSAKYSVHWPPMHMIRDHIKPVFQSKVGRSRNIGFVMTGKPRTT